MNLKKLFCIVFLMMSLTGCADTRHAVVPELDGVPRVPINKQAKNTQVFVKTTNH